jgi:hypothetical protein
MIVSTFIHLQEGELKPDPPMPNHPSYAALGIDYEAIIFVPSHRIDDFIEAALALKEKPDAK